MYENLFDLNTTGKRDFTKQLKEISIKDTFLHDAELNKNIQEVFSSVGETPTKEQSELLFGLAGITSPQVGLESFGLDVALEAGLLKKLKGLFKQSQTKKLKEFSSGQWNKVQKNYISFLNNLKSEIEKSDVEEYKLDPRQERLYQIPMKGESLDLKRLEQTFKDYIELRDTGSEYVDFMFDWYKKNVFIKGKQWTSDDVDRLEKEFEIATFKKFKFDKMPGWYHEKSNKEQKVTVRIYESMYWLTNVPFLASCSNPFDFRLSTYDPREEGAELGDILIIQKSTMLNIITSLLEAVSNVKLQPCNFLQKLEELESKLGFVVYAESPEDVSTFEKSDGLKYFDSYNTMSEATTIFTPQFFGLQEWENFTDIQVIEIMSKLIAILVDKN